MKYTDRFYAIKNGRLFYRYVGPRSDQRPWTPRFDEAKLYHDYRQAVAFCNREGLHRNCIKIVTVTRELQS